MIIERKLKAIFTSVKFSKVISILNVFHLVCLAWIFFRAEDFVGAIGYLKAMLGQNGDLSITPFIALLIFIGLGINFLPPRAIENFAAEFAKLPAPAFALVLVFLFVFIDAIREQGIAPFIYFQF